MEQGESFDVLLRLREQGGSGSPLDLTGYMVRMQIRESVDAPEPLVSLTSSPTGGIIVDGPAGTISISIDDGATSGWTWRYGVYSIEIESPAGKVKRILKGEVTLDREVVR